MKLWVLVIKSKYLDEDTDDVGRDEWIESVNIHGVYSSPELAQDAAQRAVTGKPLKWCDIWDKEPDYREVRAFIRDTWYNGDVVTNIEVYPRIIDVDSDPNFSDVPATQFVDPALLS